MKRLAALLLTFAALRPAPASAPPADYVQAVEFPYYLFPRALWERELAWIKAIGIRTVEFSIPRNWHETGPGQYDFSGETSPRRDLPGLIHILRKLGLHAWVRPQGPVPAWPATPADASTERAWLQRLDQLLAPQTAAHGGPVEYVEGGALALEAAAPPQPVTVIAATAADALAASRDAFRNGSGALVWRGVEDALYPEGWALPAGPAGIWLRKGAVGLSGDETPATGPLRRDAALLRNWGPILASLAPVPMPKPASGKLPAGISAFEVTSPAVSAVSITNRGTAAFRDDLRVTEPETRRSMVIPGVAVPPGESLWLPLDVSIGPSGLCHECSNFSGAEHIVYATAELVSIEFENGILAMEFAAPQAGEAVLQFAREPVGPYLAAGKPVDFDWDDKTLRARLKIPAGSGPGHHVRVGIAIEEPETSGFFDEAHRLVIGQKNVLSTTYSAADVARRSRLRLPEGFTSERLEKTPNQIDYEVGVPADAIHGDWANVALEADGMLLGRARLQLFRPVSIRVMEAMVLHFGSQTELTPDPPLAVIDPKGGTNLEISIRNNSSGIATFLLEPAGAGLEFFPGRAEIAVGAAAERRLGLRVFARDEAVGLRNWNLHVAGATSLDLPMRALLLPRGRTVPWSADLDGDGSPEWILESHQARAVFSSRDGGRWMEFAWKDGNLNFLPDEGALAASGPVEVHADGDALGFSGKGWKRTARLVDGSLTIEQTGPLPPDRLAPERRGNVTLSIERKSPSRVVYKLN